MDYLLTAWRDFEARAPVKLRAITSERHYRAMVEFMNALLDDIGDNESHPLAGLLDVVATFVHDFEERHVEIPDARLASPANARKEQLP